MRGVVRGAVRVRQFRMGTHCTMPTSEPVEMARPAQAEDTFLCLSSVGRARMPLPNWVMMPWTIPRTTSESPAKAAFSEGARVKTNPNQIGLTLTISREASASFTSVYLANSQNTHKITRKRTHSVIIAYSHAPGPLVELVRAAAILPGGSAAGSVLPGVSAAGVTKWSVLRAVSLCTS